MLRIILVAVAVSGGCDADAPVDPDAAQQADSVDIPTGTTYWPCYFWSEVSGTVEKCAPKCSNRTLLGRFNWGSCEYAPGQKCDKKNMTAAAGEPGAACCVYSATPFERVDIVACQ